MSSQPPTPDPLGSDGVASTATPNGGVAQVPTYALPDYIPPSNSQGYRVPTRTVWQDELGPRFLLETRIGEWLGSSDQGSSAVNVMLPFSFESSNSVLFLDARGTASWNGGGSGSVGGGLRWFDEFRNRITGVSGFWDYDDTNQRSYDQVGFGFESIGKWVTVHANGYVALGNQTNIISNRLTGSLVPGSPITAEAIQGIETAYSGFNAEIGGPTPLLGRYGFESFVGGYHFQTPDASNATGVSFRTDVNVSNDLQLGINVT
ncbi:MAG: inverse autotransporter beta domain-containing protein, partial [Rhodopirellula sp.]|nr:inverse autotransporter beta domain-containing protein [Rhodopirellula sp.]